MNQSFLANQINNTLEQKPRIRWKSATILFFLSFFGIYYYYFYYFGYFVFPAAIGSVLCSLIYVFSFYFTEEMILKKNFSWGRLVIFNLVVTVLLYVLVFLFTLIFLIGLFVEAEQGAFSYFALAVIYFVPAIVMIFSFIPSLIIKKFHPNTSKTNINLLMFFSFVAVIVFAYSWASYNSCNFNRNVKCVSVKTKKARNVNLCDSFKENKERDKCYRLSITGRELHKEDLIMCDQIKNQEIQDFCYEKVSVRIKDKTTLQEVCSKIKNNEDNKNECYINLSKIDNDIKICTNVNGYKKTECVANIAVNTKDSLLCEKHFNNEDYRSNCYKEMAVTEKWQDISICAKTIVEGDDRYYCEVSILKNFSDIPSCKEVKKTPYSHLMSQCRTDYHNNVK